MPTPDQTIPKAFIFLFFFFFNYKAFPVLCLPSSDNSSPSCYSKLCSVASSVTWVAFLFPQNSIMVKSDLYHHFLSEMIFVTCSKSHIHKVKAISVDPSPLSGETGPRVPALGRAGLWSVYRSQWGTDLVFQVSQGSKLTEACAQHRDWLLIYLTTG